MRAFEHRSPIDHENHKRQFGHGVNGRGFGRGGGGFAGGFFGGGGGQRGGGGNGGGHQQPSQPKPQPKPTPKTTVVNHPTTQAQAPAPSPKANTPAPPAQQNNPASLTQSTTAAAQSNTATNDNIPKGQTTNGGLVTTSPSLSTSTTLGSNASPTILPTLANNGVASAGSVSTPAAQGSPTGGSNPQTGSPGTQASSKGISGGAIAGIVIIFLVLLVAIAAFIIRRNLVKKRRERRNTTWGAGKIPLLLDKPRSAGSSLLAPNTPLTPQYNEKALPYPPTGLDTAYHTQNFSESHDARSPESLFVKPPPMSYNNPLAEPTYGRISIALSSSPPLSGRTETRSSLSPNDTATVRFLFIPSLPDELSVSIGETVRVVHAFDDGWTLCANTRGEQGMVPLECLQLASGAPQVPDDIDEPQTSGGDWRGMKRSTSLHSNARY